MKNRASLIGVFLIFPIFMYSMHSDLGKEIDVNDEQFINKLAVQSRSLHNELQSSYVYAQNKLTDEEKRLAQEAIENISSVTFQLEKVAQGSTEYPDFLSVMNSPSERSEYYNNWDLYRQIGILLIGNMKNK